MDINRSNYEQYFLDYLENRLNAEQKEILQGFLRFNPDLADELSAYESNVLIPEKVNFPAKYLLKKNIPGREDKFTPAHFDLYSIAYLEGDLTTVQRTAFKNYIESNPEEAEKFEQFRAAHLVPEPVIYQDKSKLKKNGAKKDVLRYLIPVAAAAAVLFFLFINAPAPEKPIDEIAILEKADLKPKQDNDVKPKVEPKIIQQASAIKVIKSNKEPVPISNYKVPEKTEIEVNTEIDDSKNEKNSKKDLVAGVQLQKAGFKEIPLNYDKIKFIPINPPSVKMSSLSVEAIARSQIFKVNRIIENENEFLYSLANNGIKEINRLAGTNAELLASKDEDGAITGIHFRSRILQVSAPISQNSD